MLCFCLEFLSWMLIGGSCITFGHAGKYHQHILQCHLDINLMFLHICSLSLSLLYSQPQIPFLFNLWIIQHFIAMVMHSFTQTVTSYSPNPRTLVHFLLFFTVKLIFESLVLSLFGLRFSAQTALCNPLLPSLPFLTLCHQRKRLPARL